MKMKWIVIPIILAGVGGVTGKFYLDYTDKKDSLAQIISDQSYNGMNINYQDMKLTELTGTEFVVNGITLNSENNNLTSTASSALVDLSSVDSGRSTFSGVNFSIEGLSGTAGLVKVNNVTISDVDKLISIELSDVSLKGKNTIIEGANLSLDINQSINSISVKMNGSSIGGDQLNVVYNAAISKELKSNNLKELILNSEVKDLDIKLQNVGLFNTLASEIDWLKPSFNEFGLKFFKHHSPRSKRIGGEILGFLQQLSTLHISVKANDSIVLNLKDAGNIKKVPNLTIFEKLNLEVESTSPNE